MTLSVIPAAGVVARRAVNAGLTPVLSKVVESVIPVGTSSLMSTLNDSLKAELHARGYYDYADKWTTKDTRFLVGHLGGKVSRTSSGRYRVSLTPGYVLDETVNDPALVTTLAQQIVSFMDSHMGVGDKARVREVYSAFREHNRLDPALYSNWLLGRYVDKERYRRSSVRNKTTGESEAAWMRLS